MKNLTERLKELKGLIGQERLGDRHIEVPEFDYKKNRKMYEEMANADLIKIQNETKLKRIQKLHGQSELNPKWTFDNLVEDANDVKEAVSIAKSFIFAHTDPNWTKSRSHMMLFYGDYGRGKSHIAGAIAHELIDKFEISVVYRQLQTLLDMRLFSYDYQASDNASMQYREIAKQLLEVDLLILDEVCVNETILKKNAQAWLGNLLRQRKTANKNCIIITNHNLQSLEQALGRYCFESIMEYETYQVQFQGPSRRKQLTHGATHENSSGSHNERGNRSQSNAYQPNQINYKK